MRILSKAFFFLSLAFFSIHNATAQKTPNKKPVATQQKFKPPKLHTSLSTYQDSVVVPVEVAENLLSMPLKIYDDKKTEYIVSSYQFMYKKRTVTEDEKTGQVSPASSIVANRFRVTPLPQMWIDQVGQQIKSGEELYFFDVIAKDAEGRIMFASNLKIITQ